MSDIEQKAQARVVEVLKERGIPGFCIVNRQTGVVEEALCRSIEQHEAFEQKVSDIVHHYVYVDGGPYDWEKLNSLIIPKPKPDPLVDAAKMMGYFNTAANAWAEDVRAALDALGFEIREKGQ